MHELVNVVHVVDAVLSSGSRHEKKVTFCDGRESNPGQLLGRQLCSPLYHHRMKTAGMSATSALYISVGSGGGSERRRKNRKREEEQQKKGSSTYIYIKKKLNVTIILNIELRLQDKLLADDDKNKSESYRYKTMFLKDPQF